MGRILLSALLTAGVLVFSPLPPVSSTGQEGTTTALPPAGSVRVTIDTGGGLFGPVKRQFKVGEDIPVVISMENTGDRPAKYCLSTSLFQNRPQLKRDGKLIPHLTNLTAQADEEEAVKNCEASAARRFHELQPKQKRVVDWLKISLMGITWYGPLPAGHYELVLMRRIGCCQGPMVESNKVAFDILP